MDVKLLLAACCLVSSAVAQPSPPSVAYSTRAIKTPVPFAEGIISTAAASEFELAFSPSGTTVYFTRRGSEGKQKIYETMFANGNWTPPQLAPFSTDRDESPFITPDGNTMFFGSERPLPGRPNRGSFDMNVWKMRKTATGWSVPEPLPAPINEVQVASEEWPSSNSNFLFSLDGRHYFYCTMPRGTASINIYQTSYANGVFSAPRVVEGLFSEKKYWQYSAVVSPDGKYLLFNSSGAPGGVGGEDIYVSRKTASGWSPAVGVGTAVNSLSEESSPRFSRDGKYFFFSREIKTDPKKDGLWDIFYVETAALNLDKLFK